MRFLLLLVFAAALPVCAQTSASQPPEDPVVAVFDGKSWKKSELESMVRALGPNISRSYNSDKRAFIAQFALMLKLASLAEADGLDKQDPHLWRLMYNRALYLAQARADAQGSRSIITVDDQKKYYEEHKDDFSKAKVKVIYLSFNDNPVKSDDSAAKKPRTSAEANALAAEIVSKARSGTDFAVLVEQFSDDAESKAKKGDFPPIKPNDATLPAPVKAAVFGIKPGQVSDPLQQAGGVWVFQLQDFESAPFDEVRDEIFKIIKEDRFKQWMASVQKEVAVEYKDSKYLDEKPAPASPGR